MRYTSVESTAVSPRKPRRRLGFLPCAKCRRPALERNTFPFAVILNRFATDFLVLMPFGRRINQILSKRARNIGSASARCKRLFEFSRLQWQKLLLSVWLAQAADTQTEQSERARNQFLPDRKSVV